MISESMQSGPNGARVERRTNLFVSARLSWGQGFAPVVIRNLSASGALVEAAVLPAPGSSVELSRGRLRVRGRVIWCQERRAGLELSSRIIVSDWLPQGSAVAQARVDRVIHDLRGGDCAKTAAASSLPEAPETGTLFEELTELKQKIESAVEQLAADPSVIAEHADKLQLLDMVAHRLANALKQFDS